MKKILLTISLLLASFSAMSCNNITANSSQNLAIKPEENTKIQVAILLDTSGSMDGLIEQAKSRLWNIVNTLTTLKYSGKIPTIEIALYEYGNDGIAAEKNYIRQVTPLTTDLDLISEKLFSLRTNGGSEYCGAVIGDATKELKWDDGKNNMKLVYICGNEGFDQGPINYKEAISDALKKGIYINTIFCGNQDEGIRLFWKNGADVAQGKFFNINSNETIHYIATPYDVRINELNIKINMTYIGYGTQGEAKKMNQTIQDKNAESISAANFTERAVSKSKAVYTNTNWDLVDRVKDDKDALSKIKTEELPAELKGKSEKEIKVIVAEKTKEREAIQKEIAELAKKRQDYIDAEAKKQNTKDDLGNAISNSIIELAKTKKYTVDLK
ncbi:vWA domain-containing protein [Flavobacterium terrigena]|uniref:von Willebrand factor type A domain-containing protein n=1 Tax=Flavobacterium terrigena TaxID=402734 RepID=A0A1H6SRW1_9FLAO|nr:VWA domain-containing protein [Flavobacterium terrigena]SEI69626.1 von Willebrand factor type A domain-containing protein [Flavobacterium terrigena]